MIDDLEKMAKEKRAKFINRLSISESKSDELLNANDFKNNIFFFGSNYNLMQKSSTDLYEESIKDDERKSDTNSSNVNANANDNGRHKNSNAKVAESLPPSSPALSISRKTYLSLLSAVLDPFAHIRETHNFQPKILTKIITCDGCHGVVWGIHRQGLQCAKCFLCIHEKCQELVQRNCSLQDRRYPHHTNLGQSSSQKSKTGRRNFLPAPDSPLVADESIFQNEITKRHNEIERSYPNYLNKIRSLFKVDATEFKNDIKRVQQNYLNRTEKQIKTRLRIFVKNACDLLAKDSCGTSDPYVTIQCGFSKLKRTKTQQKNLNPVWNETIEFEYLNTADGIVTDLGNCGNKIIIRVWDEDVGLKAQLDKMLTNEADDFLGQVVLDINDLNLNVEQSYQLRPRTDGSNVSGYINLKINLKVIETLSYLTRTRCFRKDFKVFESTIIKNDVQWSYIEEYRCLHRHIFKYILKSCATGADLIQAFNNTKWLLECVPSNFNESTKNNYFREFDYNLMLKHFANKYVINESQKQIIHLECFFKYFVDKYYLNNNTSCLLSSVVRRDFTSNCKIFDYMTCLLSGLNLNYLQDETFTQNDTSLATSSIKILRSFLRQVFSLPDKLTHLLSNYRLNYAIRYRIVKSKIETLNDGDKKNSSNNNFHLENNAIDEMRETIDLFRAGCWLIDNYLKLSPKNELIVELTHSSYDVMSQYEMLKHCIESSLFSYFSHAFLSKSDTTTCDESSGPINIATAIAHGVNKQPLHTTPNERRNSSCSSVNKLIRLNEFGSLVEDNDSIIDNDSNSSTSMTSLQSIISKLEVLINVISQKLFLEIEINEKLYFRAFFYFSPYFSNEFGFRQFCTRLLIKRLLIELLDTIRNDPDIIGKMRPENIKLHLNLHLLIKRFLADNGLDRLSLRELLSCGNDDAVYLSNNLSSLNELFQPFLLEFIREQEDQFIKYIHKIYDTDKINSLAEEIAKTINENCPEMLQFNINNNYNNTNYNNGTVFMSSLAMATAAATPINSDSYSLDLKSNRAIYDLENYYSPSVTDLFTILHELLQTVIIFDSKNSDINLPHQMCFVNLIKSKLLAYSAHVKKEYHKIYRSGSFTHSTYIKIGRDSTSCSSGKFTALDITSCILMNNFKKTIELLDDIEIKLTNRSELKQVVVDQLESIKLILKDDLNNMISEYANEYERPLVKACQRFQRTMYGHQRTGSTSSNDGEHVNMMKNLIDETLYNIFNDRFTICKIVLFDSIFRRLLGDIFKLTVRCIESWVILNRDDVFNGEHQGINANIELNNHNNDENHTTDRNFFNKFSDYFYRTKKDLMVKDRCLLNEFQYKSIQHCLKHLVDFFSGDEAFLKKDFLTNTSEYQSALKTLDLYLLSSNQLISSFIRSQNANQNNCDFSKCHGKFRFQVEVRQNVKFKTEFFFNVKFFEVRFLQLTLDSNGSVTPLITPPGSIPSIEVYLLGPCSDVKWNRKLINYTHFDYANQIYFFDETSSFEFKVNVTNSELRVMNERTFMNNYELMIVFKETSQVSRQGSSMVIGMAVFNLSESINSSRVWKRLKYEEQTLEPFSFRNPNRIDLASADVYGMMELWLSLRPRLKINDYGLKLLKILEKHKNDRRAIEFIHLKSLTRGCLI